MKDRFTFYGIILGLIYLGLYAWNQHQQIKHLDEVTVKQYEQLMQCRDLIKAQREYIDLLEADYSNPLYRPRYPLKRGPI